MKSRLFISFIAVKAALISIAPAYSTLTTSRFICDSYDGACFVFIYLSTTCAYSIDYFYFIIYLMLFGDLEP